MMGTNSARSPITNLTFLPSKGNYVEKQTIDFIRNSCAFYLQFPIRMNGAQKYGCA
jgi:hypothetical protein